MREGRREGGRGGGSEGGGEGGMERGREGGKEEERGGSLDIEDICARKVMSCFCR